MSVLDSARSRFDERSKFDYDLSRITPLENTIAELLNGLGMFKVEMKHDYQAWRTGRVFVETRRWAYDGSGKEPSGLSITEADVYIQTLDRRGDIYILDVDLLRGYANNQPEYEGGDGHRSLGVFIPLDHLRTLYPRKLWAAMARELWAAMGGKVQNGY